MLYNNKKDDDNLLKKLRTKIPSNTQWHIADHTFQFIKTLCKEVENKRFLDKQKVLKFELAESRDKILKQGRRTRTTCRSNNNSSNNNSSGGTEKKDNDDDQNGAYFLTSNIFPQLPSLALPEQSQFNMRSKDKDQKLITFKHYQHKSFKHSKSLPKILIEGSHNPRPISTASIFLKRHYAVDDQKELTFLPYFGDDKTDKELEDIKDLFDLKRREHMDEHGPEFIEQEIDNFIRDVLNVLFNLFGKDIFQHTSTKASSRVMMKPKLYDVVPTTKQNKNDENSILSNLFSQIAQIKEVDITKVDQIYHRFFDNRYHEGNVIQNQGDKSNVKQGKEGQILPGDNYSNNGTLNNSNINNCDSGVLQYENVMDSYRTLFCRQCYVYDCNVHGNLSPPSLKVQTEVAICKENEAQNVSNGTAFDKEVAMMLPYSKSVSSSVINTCLPCTDESEGVEHDKDLSPLQQVICAHSCDIFRGNISDIALTFGIKSTKPIRDYMDKMNITLRDYNQSNIEDMPEPKKKKSKMSGYYNQEWLKRVKNTEIHPAFYPCNHDEPCSDDTCTCVQNAVFCTKHCVWGTKSRNMFRGCMCKNGQCNTNCCPCFAAHRECDPDLCNHCLACTDPPNRPATKQRCRNDNLSMRRHCHLLLSESGIQNAGWGIYNKHGLKKGDFVHEYVGELISQEEAERRGVLYDKLNRSYLFNLTSDSVVDASRKGNKMKYANHSGNKPNCYAKILTVNGDSRIGLFAGEDIEPQTELFFDYAYDLSINNDLIEKPGIIVDWMKNPKQSKKKHA